MDLKGNTMRLENKIAIVTGGSRGIGLAISLAFSREGARVVIASNDLSDGKAAVNSIKDSEFIATDVSKKNQIENLVNETIKMFGRVDILVNCAAIHQSDSFENEPQEIWESMFQVNVLGTVFPSQAVTKIMKKQGSGKIVHIASKAGVVGEPGHAAYSACKGAIISLTRAMAIELAPFHINVNSVCPGPVMTDLLRATIPDPKQRAILAAEAPLGRMGTPEDIAAAVLYLACSDSDWMTGQALSVDGGYSILK
jgi:NAD(P)-dependent dehydrogenase (short-subunit alcohol dehydrogenase family)